MGQSDELIADIMGAQARLQHLFADDRSDPLFSSHLTMSQLKILFLLSRHGNVRGGELAALLGIGPATLSAMIDRLVAQGLVTRTEDTRDRRIRRIGLTKTGADLIGRIITAGAEKQRLLLSRLSGEELAVVARAMHLLVRVAEPDPARQRTTEPGPASFDAGPGSGHEPVRTDSVQVQGLRGEQDVVGDGGR